MQTNLWMCLCVVSILTILLSVRNGIPNSSARLWPQIKLTTCVTERGMYMHVYSKKVFILHNLNLLTDKNGSWSPDENGNPWNPFRHYPDSKVHGANMGPIWGRQDPGGPYVGPMNFAIWVVIWSSRDLFRLCVRTNSWLSDEITYLAT